MARPKEARRARLLRPGGFDELGLRRALSDRVLPALVAAMSFLAALALAGGIATASLARHWQAGAANIVTVQVPKPGQAAEHATGPDETRLLRALAVLRDAPAIASARVLEEEELNALLRPWLGAGVERLSLPLPAVIEVHLRHGTADVAALARRLSAAVPGIFVESHGTWLGRLSALANSLIGCAALAVLVVGLVSAAVIAVATRAGLVQRRDAIEIVHGLGATDGFVAGRFARRAARLAALGGLGGAVAALPVLLLLASLAAPFAAPDLTDGLDATPGARIAGAAALIPPALWAILPGLPVVAAAIGFLTAQATVRRWLRRLP